MQVLELVSSKQSKLFSYGFFLTVHFSCIALLVDLISVQFTFTALSVHFAFAFPAVFADFLPVHIAVSICGLSTSAYCFPLRICRLFAMHLAFPAVLVDFLPVHLALTALFSVLRIRIRDSGSCDPG
jgi:hypothetical protein